VAGVPESIMVVPAPNGELNPLVLAVIDILYLFFKISLNPSLTKEGELLPLLKGS
jgi:hypothetical protein